MAKFVDIVFVTVVRKIFFACFIGDLGHELAQYAWGTPFKLLLQGEYHGDAHSTFTTFLSRLSARPLAALRLITKAFLVAFEGLVSWALWCLTMMASIASIAIGGGLNHIHRNWQWCCCLLLLVPAVLSSDAHVVFVAVDSYSSVGPINLDWGGCLLSFGWTNHCKEAFLHAIFFVNDQEQCLVMSWQMMLMALLKSKITSQEQARLRIGHILWASLCICYAKNVVLQLVTYLRTYLSSLTCSECFR